MERLKKKKKVSWLKTLIRLKALRQLKKENFLITQNIDGLHQKSGIPNNKIIEIHGSAIEAECIECEEKQNIFDFHAAIKKKISLPKCSKCNGIVKVATISFGQPMNKSDMANASKISSECDLMMVMGSSLQVMPANQLPSLAMQSGSKVVIFNREKTSYDSFADIVINDELKNICSKLIKEI